MSSKPSPKSPARKSSASAAPKSGAKKPAPARSAKSQAATGATKTPPALPAPRPVHESKLAPSSKSAEVKAALATPTELSSEVMEFITAIDEYKRQRRRPFPNWSEVFEVVKALGYHKSA
ncbi:MAG TPA: hypothetical protein VK843_04040 [Planctomycetota bacterium]|nr:hypothetical protein [Planctomycetota bacterium]